MALANDMSALLKKIKNRLGLAPLMPYLPKELAIDKWAEVIEEDTFVSFSRYYPNRIKIIVSDETCYRKVENGTTYYYIKDEILQDCKLLGVMDIDWQDYSSNNASLGSASLSGERYYPAFACPEATFESVLALQFNANINSLYNNDIVIEFEYPNRFYLKGVANTSYNLERFPLILLIQHHSLATISPTKMEIFESLAQADIARFLYMNLRYFDNLETAYLNLDLKLSELNEEANKRDDIINTLKESYVSTSNDNIPYIMSVSGTGM